MKIYIVSLASDFARREKLTAQLEALDLEFEIFTAVDGRNGLPEQYLRWVDFDGAARQLGRKFGNGEAACALSHSLIYEKIVAEGHPWALILEDDVSVDANLAKLLRSDSYRNGELLLLNHRFSYVWRFSKIKLFDAFDSYRLLLPCWMTAAYLISNTGAAYLLKHTRPVNTTADWPGNIVELGARVCVPVLAHHPAQGCSSLSSERQRGHHKDRFFSLRYWTRWIRKRLSIRIA